MDPASSSDWYWSVRWPLSTRVHEEDIPQPLTLRSFDVHTLNLSCFVRNEGSSNVAEETGVHEAFGRLLLSGIAAETLSPDHGVWILVFLRGNEHQFTVMLRSCKPTPYSNSDTDLELPRRKLPVAMWINYKERTMFSICHVDLPEILNGHCCSSEVVCGYILEKQRPKNLLQLLLSMVTMKLVHWGQAFGAAEIDDVPSLFQIFLADIASRFATPLGSLENCSLDSDIEPHYNMTSLQNCDIILRNEKKEELGGWNSAIGRCTTAVKKQVKTSQSSFLLQHCFKLPLLTVVLLMSLMLSTVKSITQQHPAETTVMLFLVCTVGLTGASTDHHTNALKGTWNDNEQIFTVKLWGSPNTGFCAEITIGVENDQQFCVLVDTGSANLAIAGRDDQDIDEWFHIDQSSSYEDLGKSVTVSYTAGEWTGRLSRDLISIDGAEQVNAYLVVITDASNFYIDDADWVGILGLAYRSLAKPDSSILTFWDTFRDSNGLEDVFSLQLCQPLDIPLLDITQPQDGWMDLGGINQSRFHGSIFYTGIVNEKFYNVLVTNLTVGNVGIGLDCSEFNTDQSIVDSGTTDIFLPEKVFKAVRAAFINYFKDGLPLVVPEEFWTGGRKLAWPVDDKHTIYSAFPTFYIGFATSQSDSEEFSLAVTPQIYLRQIEGTSDEQALTNCYPECDFFTFGIKQREKGTVIGGNIMLGFYTIFDRVKRRVGFAKSTCEFQDEEEEAVPHIVGPYPREPADCSCQSCESGMPYWETISYVCGGIVIPLAILSVTIAVTSRVVQSNCVKRSRCCCKRRHLLLYEEDETGTKYQKFLCCCKRNRRKKYGIASEEAAVPFEEVEEFRSSTPPSEAEHSVEFHLLSPQQPLVQECSVEVHPQPYATPEAVLDDKDCESDCDGDDSKALIGGHSQDRTNDHTRNGRRGTAFSKRKVSECKQPQESASAVSGGCDEHNHERLSKQKVQMSSSQKILEGKHPFSRRADSYQEQTRVKEDFKSVHEQGRVESGSSTTRMIDDFILLHEEECNQTYGLVIRNLEGMSTSLTRLPEGVTEQEMGKSDDNEAYSEVNDDSLNLCGISEPAELPSIQTSDEACSSVPQQPYGSSTLTLLDPNKDQCGASKVIPQLAATRADIGDENCFYRQPSTASCAESERGQGCYSRQGSNCSRQDSVKD